MYFSKVVLLVLQISHFLCLRYAKVLNASVSEVSEKFGEDSDSSDYYWTTPQLIAQHGYPFEAHTVQTEDGYLLEVHRIPRHQAKPVLFMHGLLDASDSAVLLGPEYGLGYVLYNDDYDVWLGNFRGTKYSQEHITLRRTSKKFWDYSFHEMGVFDIPALIKYILHHTGYKKLHYIGYSQGSTAFWIMCSERHDICEKVALMSAIAPVAFLSHTKIDIIKTLSPFVKQNWLVSILTELGRIDLSMLRQLVGPILCHDNSITYSVCNKLISWVSGYKANTMNRTSSSALIAHLPDSISTKQLIHFGQIIDSKNFTKFDYGSRENLRRYGTPTPPSYNLSSVIAPVILYYSSDDQVVVAEDVFELQSQLPNLRDVFIISIPNFSHLDFLYSVEVKKLLYDKILDEMHKFDQFVL